MKLNNVRLLVNDFDSCFRFYSEKVGLAVTWGKLGGDYASFDIGIDSNKMGLSIFKTDLMATAIGNFDKQLPLNCREKIVIVIQVDNVDGIYKKLTDNGIDFINKPIDIAGWGSRVAHFKDPEDNLIEIYSELSKDNWSNDLIEESKDYDTN
ncbi:MAG: VOC family protein [Bacteroidales bacterium]|nr:MAG: VOC family protein [Bacteroidales bacterium]